MRGFWKTLEMSISNSETGIILTWFTDCIISAASGTPKFTMADTKLYAPLVVLSIQDTLRAETSMEQIFVE